MFSKPSPDFLTPQEKNERRLALWNGAIKIVKSVVDAHQKAIGRDDCGWRGDHRDVAMIANHLSTIRPDDLRDQIKEAGNWLNGERDRTSDGMLIRHNPTIVHDLVSHLQRKFRHV